MHLKKLSVRLSSYPHASRTISGRRDLAAPAAQEQGWVSLVGALRIFLFLLALAIITQEAAATGGFLPTGGMSFPRTQHAAARLSDGRVLVVGGDSPCCPRLPLSSAELYDPLTGTFSLTGSMSTGRDFPTATLLASGKVLVVGAGASAELYDPAAGTFSPTGSLFIPRSGHTATLLHDGKVLVAGGYFNGELVSAEVYDPVTGIFSPVGNTTTPRYFHAATLLQNGKVLLTGGFGLGTTAELYDPASRTFSPTASMSTPRHFHAATLLPNGKVLVTGIDALNPPPLGSPSAEIYDPTSGSFSPTGDMGIPRYGHQATLLPYGEVLITGGATGAELYDPATGEFRSAGVAAGFFGPATLLQNGEVLACGGSGDPWGNSIWATAELWSASIVSAPTIFAVDPQSTVQNGSSFTLTVSGSDFAEGATIQWNGSARPTTFVDDWQLTATISAADIASAAEFFTTATVTVNNPNGEASNPVTFTIWQPDVSAAQVGSIPPGQSGIYISDGREHGFTGTVNNQDAAPLPITLAIYSQNPAPRSFADMGAGYLALRIPGASAADSATVVFDFPADNLAVYPGTPGFALLYFSGSRWAPVLSSGGVPPTLAYTDPFNFPDGNASGNFTVVFDNTSTPKITELGNSYVFSFGILPNPGYRDFSNGGVGIGGSGGAEWFDNFRVGAPGIPPQLISTLDYSDTFTITSIRTDGLYDDNSNGAYAVEDNHGNPPSTWTAGVFGIFSFNSPGNTTHPPIVTAATGNAGANTGLAQATENDFSIGYGLRSDYVVQVDAILPIDRFDDNRVDISSLAAAGGSTSTSWGFGGAQSLTVYFWPDSSTRGGITLCNGTWETHLYDASGEPILTGVNDHNWHNYAVEFNQTDSLLRIYVDRLLKATVDLATFALPVAITCPADIVVTAAPAQSTAAVNFNVTATEANGVDVLPVVCNPPSGSAFPLGTTTVNCTASDGFGNTASCSFNVTVYPPPPSVTSLSPNTAPAGSPGLTLTVNGSDFISGAVLQWNGAARPTTFVSSSQLSAAISAADLVGGSDIVTVMVNVVNPDGAPSNPQSFAITPASVSAAQTTAAAPGQAVSVSTAPTTSGAIGVTATVNDTGSSPVSLTVANYSSNPSGTAFNAGGGFTDVQVAGASPAVTATVSFYYPSTIDAATEVALTLVYYNGSGWVPVRSNGNTDPVKNTTDNLDGTISGGRFTVVFSSTSTPQITQLTGTLFGAANIAPTITFVSTPVAPMQVQTSVSVSVTYSAAGNPSTHQVTLDWKDRTSTVITPAISGIVNASHVYGTPGVYTITVTLNDSVHPPVQAASQYVVIYDPNGGFVTGGGSFTSPAGAYRPNPNLTGQASFGFVSKYQKGATVPTGNTEFDFQAAGLSFHSTAYDYLVISGAKAQYKGSGTLNGSTGYRFLLTAIDGQVNGGGGTDKLRMKIKDSTGNVIYDNQLGASDDSDPTTVIQGSIVIHK